MLDSTPRWGNMPESNVGFSAALRKHTGVQRWIQRSAGDACVNATLDSTPRWGSMRESNQVVGQSRCHKAWSSFVLLVRAGRLGGQIGRANQAGKHGRQAWRANKAGKPSGPIERVFWAGKQGGQNVWPPLRRALRAFDNCCAEACPRDRRDTRLAQAFRNVGDSPANFGCHRDQQLS